MKISYVKGLKMYRIDLNYPETELYIKTDDIVEAREMFLDGMKSLFDETLREQLKD